MAVINNARFNLPELSMSLHRDQAGPDMTAAKAVQAFGQVGGSAYKGYLEANLENELQDTGNIINTINAGEDAIGDAVTKGQIDPTTDKFKRLAAATKQGKISQQRATIEAEVILRQSINKAPGFADDLRKLARTTLGFDPTSASVNSLFLSGPDASKRAPQTQSEKDLDLAQAMVDAGQVESIAQGINFIGRNRQADLEASIDKQQIERGKISGTQVTVKARNSAQTAMNGIMQQAMNEIKQTGGVQNIEAFKAGLIAAAEAETTDFHNRMAGSTDAVYEQSVYDNVSSGINELLEANLAILDNQDQAKVLARNIDILENMSTAQMAQVAPALFLMRELPPIVTERWLELQQITGGDPTKRKHLVKIDPQYAFVSDLVEGLDISAEAVKAAAQGKLAQAVTNGTVSQQEADAVTAKDALDIINGQVDLNADPDFAKNAYTNLQESGKLKKGLSMIAQAGLTPSQTDTEAVARDFQTGTEQQVITIGQSLAGTPYEMKFDGKRFMLADTSGRSAKEIFKFSPSTFASKEAEAEYMSSIIANETGASQSLGFLNDNLSFFAKDRAWDYKLGLGGLQTWGPELTGRINAVGAGQLAQFTDAATGTQVTTGTIDRGPQADFDLSSELIRDEGFVASAKGDPIGIPTIGHGHNLQANPLTPEDKEAMGIDPSVPDEDVVLTEAQAKILLARDIARTEPLLRAEVPEYDSQPPAVKQVLMNMAFNMGAKGVSGFKKMLKALSEGDYNTAADELEDSKFGRGEAGGKVLGGLKLRAKRLANTLRDQAGPQVEDLNSIEF